MEISEVRVRKVQQGGKLKAYVTVTFDDQFVVHNIKIIEGQEGNFIAMPSGSWPTGSLKISFIQSPAASAKAAECDHEGVRGSGLTLLDKTVFTIGSNRYWEVAKWLRLWFWCRHRGSSPPSRLGQSCGSIALFFYEPCIEGNKFSILGSWRYVLHIL